MKKHRRNSCLILSLVIVLITIPCTGKKAEAKTSIPFTLTQAKALACASSREYRKISGSIALKQVEYMQAIKSIWMKRLDKATFRWSPLLSFQFPQQPNLAEAVEWQYKPQQIQTELQSLRHELGNVKYKLSETVSTLYTEAYVNQEKIAFTAGRIQVVEETLTRNRARVSTGEANQSDIDKMEQEIQKLTSDLSLLKRDFESKKSKLTELTKLDISTGFVFQEAFVDAPLERTLLENLTERTLKENQAFYKVKLDESLGKISLELNESLLNSQFGSKMNIIKPYLIQAKQGQEINGDAFKAAYEQFLEIIDAPWQGHIRILFIKIPKEWFKGAVDGIRYVQDEPYALYAAAMEYEELRITRENAEKELRTQVSDSFESVMTAQNAYRALDASVEILETEVKKSEALNKVGKMSYEELAAIQDEYETSQMDLLDALSAYNSLIFSFDSLTCGGITAYLEAEGVDTTLSSGGDSFLVKEEAEGAFYYIESYIEDNLFEFGVYIPDDYSITLTDFELWIDGTRIGGRTPVSETIRHLTLDLKGIEEAVVRFYNGEAFVDECSFQPMVTKAELTITGGYRRTEEPEREVASYSSKKNTSKGLTEFLLKKAAGEDIAYYRLMDSEGKPLLAEELIEEGKMFAYLSVLLGDVSQIKVELYDSQKELLYMGRLNEDTMKVLATE